MKLPSGKGADVLDALHETNSNARSVLITGFRAETEREVQDALRQGASAICYKPFDVDELLQIVHSLSSSRTSDPSEQQTSTVE
jgi:DNA-binding NarL/FixJ family response regulator